jgi:preprotein translocase subunit SecG
MVSFLIVIHVLISILLILSILLQSSKGGGMAGMFGGGGTFGGVFGGRGAASFLAKLTMILGIAFGITSLVITVLSSGSGRAKGVIERAMQRENVSSPATILPTVPEGGNLQQPQQSQETNPSPAK